MNIQAIGLIETKGLIAAIVGADTMIKAANVEIVGNKYYKVKSGIVTMIVTGDVGAVKAAVEIGAQEAKKVGTLITSHTIARPDDFVIKMIVPDAYEEVKEELKKKDKEEVKKEETKNEAINQEKIVIEPIIEKTKETKNDKIENISQTKTIDSLKEDKAEKNKSNKEEKRSSKEDKKNKK